MNRYKLRLFVSGSTPQAQRAIRNLEHLCDAELHGNFDCEVVDAQQDPEAAEADKIFATPTLVRLWPLPVRKILGDMSDGEKVMLGLGIRPDEDEILQ